MHKVKSPDGGVGYEIDDSIIKRALVDFKDRIAFYRTQNEVVALVHYPHKHDPNSEEIHTTTLLVHYPKDQHDKKGIGCPFLRSITRNGRFLVRYPMKKKENIILIQRTLC